MVAVVVEVLDPEGYRFVAVPLETSDHYLRKIPIILC